MTAVRLGGRSKPTITDRQVAFTTPWFQVIAKTIDGNAAAPHYTVKPGDYVIVLATDVDGRLLLVKQFRPVVEDYTLELPSGQIDPGETPESSARRELLEETGHQAGKMELLGALVPDTGRLGNLMWCFAATGLRQVAAPSVTEEGIELVTCTPAEFVDELRTLRCNHALNFAALMLAVLKGRFGTLGGL